MSVQSAARIIQSAARQTPEVSLDPAQARSLYRRFLRIYYKWPAEPTRPGRNLRDHTHQRIRKAFRAPLPSQSNAALVIRDAEYRLKHLRELVDDVSLDKYGVPESFAPIYRPAYNLLATDVQLKQADLKAYKMIIPMISTYIEQAVLRVKNIFGIPVAKPDHSVSKTRAAKSKR